MSSLDKSSFVLGNELWEEHFKSLLALVKLKCRLYTCTVKGIVRRENTTTHEAVSVDSLPTIHVYMYCTCTVKGLVRRELQ